MSHFIGATGLDIFNDAITTAIEETTITLTDLIDAVAIQDNLNAIYSSNYSDKVGIFGSNYTELNSVYSSNYANKVGIWGSNYTDREISYTSNYVKTTSNILVNRIKLLEGSEGTAGDPSADPPVPPVPPSGTYAILAAIGVLTAASVANGVTAITLINNLTGVVNNNATFGSNYAYDKVGMYSSNYSDRVGVYSSNYAYHKVGMYSSNYTERLIAAIPSYTNYWTTSGTNDIYLNQAGSVGIGTNTPQNKLHIYNATSSALRLETATTGTASVIFQRGTTTDIRTDYRIINDGDILKFQYQDNLINFGATGSDIMRVYDKRTEFVKDGYFSGSMGIGMLPNVNALSITGDTYMDGSLGINTPAGSYPLDVYGDVNIDGDVGIGANPLAGVKLYVSGATRLGGSVGIGVAPTSYALDIIGSSRFDGYVGIGTIPSSSTYRLDILGNFRTQGGIVSTGIIQAGNGLTASSGLITASAGISSTTLTTSGLITANAGITIPSGQTLTSTGTTILTGNVGIGTTSHATYKVDVNGSLNATSLLVGGNPISGSKWTTATDTTEIYYNTGNVGIGTTDPLCKLQIGIASQVSPFITGTFILASHGNTFINNVLSFGIPYRESGANFPCNKINFYKVAGYGIGFGLGNDGIEYFAGGPYSSGNHLFYTGATDTSFGTERMRIKSDGNVGIGNTAPLGLLHLGDASKANNDGHIIFAKCTTLGSTRICRVGYNNSFDFVIGDIGGGNTLSGWTEQFKINYNAPVNSLVINANGFITTGVVTTGAFPAGVKLSVYGSDNNGWSAAFKHPNDSQGIAIKYDGLAAMGFNTNQDLWMTPKGTGMFQVSSSSYAQTINGGFLGTGGAGSGTYFWGNICAKFNGSAWMTGSVIASSDSRIKEDIQDINDDEALNKLLAIEPKTYKYVDKIAKGDKKVYGFIAQQVREVIPEATIIEKSYIPNIMVIGDYNDYIITLPSQPLKVIIKVNDNIKCIDDNGNVILVKVEEVIDEITFKIKAIDDMKPLEYTHDKIFIHGTEVEDFHTLSKEYIFTLNVCATQELHRRIKSQEERIKELEEKMAQVLYNISI